MSDGEIIIDGYKLINCIASGNSSEVWEVVEQLGGTQSLAMKVLLPVALENPDARAVLKHEAKVGKVLDHPSIIKTHKISITKKHAYVVMDYFRAPNVKSQLTSDLVGLHVRFRKIFESVCLALGYMHEKGWVHKDMKPDNVLVNKAGELRLIDFSLAVRSASGLSKMLGGKSKVVQGTKTYIAPETLLKKASTFQTDMYSLGITMFEVLTGGPPFRGMSPNELLRMHVQVRAPLLSTVNPNVTPEMDRLVARLLAKKPADRHKSMEEVYAEFRAIKVFKEEPKELHDRKTAERKKADIESLGGSERVSSRRDHKRSEMGLNAPNKPAPKPAPQSTAPPEQPQRQAPPSGQPVAGQGYPAPGMPMGMPQNVAYPNYPPPQSPGYQQQPGSYPPGYGPPPGYGSPPGYPPGYGPPPGYQAAGPYPPGYAPPNPQAPAQPSQPQPAPSQPTASAPKPVQETPQPPSKADLAKKQQQEEDDLPLMEMDDLPDVL